VKLQLGQPRDHAVDRRLAAFGRSHQPAQAGETVVDDALDARSGTGGSGWRGATEQLVAFGAHAIDHRGRTLDSVRQPAAWSRETWRLNSGTSGVSGAESTLRHAGGLGRWSSAQRISAMKSPQTVAVVGQVQPAHVVDQPFGSLQFAGLAALRLDAQHPAPARRPAAW
jgi:hypothetical protein